MRKRLAAGYLCGIYLIRLRRIAIIRKANAYCGWSLDLGLEKLSAKPHGLQLKSQERRGGTAAAKAMRRIRGA